MKKKYIHYGASAFDIDLFNKKKEERKNIDISYLNKPRYGFWASPVNTSLGWKAFCEGEEFHTDRLKLSFKFRLKNGSKILTVRKPEDVYNYLLPTLNGTHVCSKYMDFFTIMKKFDGMELIHGDNYWALHSDIFYNWDVDSIVIWRPEIIEAI